MAHTYIIYSEQADKYYIGYCQKDLEDRIRQHNESRYGGKVSSCEFEVFGRNIFYNHSHFFQYDLADKISDACYLIMQML